MKFRFGSGITCHEVFSMSLSKRKSSGEPFYHRHQNYADGQLAAV